MRPVSDGQVRKLMEELSKHGTKGLAAIKAGMDRKTAGKYAAASKLPSELPAPRDWRTREDPFADDWPEVEALLETTPELEAKTLFEVLCERHPDRHEPGELRTLQRRVRVWRGGPWAREGHRPRPGAPARRGRADRLHDHVRAGHHDRRPAVRAPAVRLRAALLQLAVGDGLPIGIPRRAAARRAAGAVPAWPGAEVPPDGQLDGRDAPDPRRQ